MTQSEASQTGMVPGHPEEATAPDDTITCAWSLWAALRGFSRGLLLDPGQERCSRVATCWLDLRYMTPYPPSESPLPFCDEHRADVLRQFEGSVPNWQFVGEEPVEAGADDHAATAARGDGASGPVPR